ncbi:MAG: DUF2939 domain-containing protein [Caulobacteraceae bacterium]
MGKILGVLAFLAVLVFLAAYFASPVWSFHELDKAARAGDRDRLEALVDFPAVRDSLKRQVDSRVTKLARGASGIGWLPLQALGKIGSLFGDRSIDRLVTPEAVSMMVTSGETPRKHHRKVAAGEEAASATPSQGGVTARYAYLTPDRFRVTVIPRGDQDLGIDLIMDRRGLFSWRVEEIVLPGSKKASGEQS